MVSCPYSNKRLALTEVGLYSIHLVMGQSNASCKDHQQVGLGKRIHAGIPVRTMIPGTQQNGYLIAMLFFQCFSKPGHCLMCLIVVCILGDEEHYVGLFGYVFSLLFYWLNCFFCSHRCIIHSESKKQDNRYDPIFLLMRYFHFFYFIIV